MCYCVRVLPVLMCVYSAYFWTLGSIFVLCLFLFDELSVLLAFCLLWGMWKGFVVVACLCFEGGFLHLFFSEIGIL